MQWVLVALFLLFIVGRPILAALKRNRSGFAGLPGAVGNFYSLLENGNTARGILLKVGTQRSAQGNVMQGYYELISVRIDVEPDGGSSYEVDCQLQVPANMRRLVLPGATVELRVDPSMRTNIALYGPGVGLPTAG